TAMAYTYHRCTQSDEGRRTALKIFQSLVAYTHRYGMPRRRVLESAIGLAPLLISHDEFDAPQRAQLNQLLGQLVGQTLYADSQNILIPPVRRLLLWFFMQLILRLIASFSTKGTSAANLMEWQSAFERYTVEQRRPVYEALPYLDHRFGSLDEIRDLLPALRRLKSQLMNQVINYALLPRGVLDPDATLPVVESLFDLDDGDNGEHIDAIYVWFVCMEALEASAVKETWLDAQRRFARRTLEEGRYGYGVYHTNLGTYTYYPLMFYASLYNRLHPDQEVDLIADFVEEARKDNDESLLLHIIDGFSDNRFRLTDYRGPLRSLRHFISDDRGIVQDSLVNTLGYLQRFHPKQIQRFLDEHHAPQVLRNRVFKEGPRESEMELCHLAMPRGNHFVRDMLIEMEQPSVQLVIRVLDEAFHKETFYDGAQHVVKQLINQIGGTELF
ncbi:MAG: hypothetical protein JXC32_14400, partial [Anaerolineae bacterium]|nr:hypothetical protein [Anaerolineae bacterium]